jgi:hypothetical protein
MRVPGFLLALAWTAPLAAQPVVQSPAPDRVAVTVYRNPERGTQALNLDWVGGYALVSEVRRVRLPAGLSELRFEGVTSGIVPQTAIVTGLGGAVLEKNRDARLLSPGALIDAHLGERVMLRRTSRETGAVRMQDAIVRASASGVVIQTEQGFEALRCTGLSETLLTTQVPSDLSAKPTLSVLVRSAQPIETDVTLSYITNNFDWQANYVAELSPDGRELDLFAWLTLANGDRTGLADASTQAVAGKLNWQRVWVEPGDASPIRLECWPAGRTHEIPTDQHGEDIVVTGSRIGALRAPPPPPPPPPPEPERGGDEDIAMIAQEERLGDVRLYRIPEAVTVAARSQKQVALLSQRSVAVESIHRLRPGQYEFEVPFERLLVTRNESKKGLGLPLPSGGVALFGEHDGRRILIGEGSIDDHTIGEKVEIRVGRANGTRARQTVIQNEDDQEYLLTLTNDAPEARMVEVELPLEARAIKGGKLEVREGWRLWRIRMPPNATRMLRYRIES